MTQMPHQKPSDRRVAVEAALATGTRENPLTAQDVARITGFHLYIVRGQISNAVGRGVAHNIGTSRSGVYVAGPAPRAKASHEAASRIPTGFYNGAELRPFTARPGAMDAYALDSIQNGEAVPRARPVIMSTSAPQRAVRAQ